jgi:hypothetical protein
MTLVRLTTVEDGMEAEMICALLREYEVRCAVAGSLGPTAAARGIVGSAMRAVQGDLAPTDVLVHEDDLELAQQVLAAPIVEDEPEPGT